MVDLREPFRGVAIAALVIYVTSEKRAKFVNGRILCKCSQLEGILRIKQILM